jgi:hypothetical protein
VRPRLCCGDDRRPHRGADDQGLAADGQGLLNEIAEQLRGRLDEAGRLRYGRRHDDGELVAADPRDARGAGRGEGREPQADPAQNLIADGLASEFVDIMEAIEIRR